MKKTKKRRTHRWILFVVIALILGSGIYSYALRQQESAEVIVQDYIKGNPDADVVITKYSDLECPACRAAYPIVNEFLEEYGDQVRFEYKHLPLSTIHPNAVPAAEALEAAGQQGKFWEMHDLLFDRQGQWSRSYQPKGVFIGYGKELDLDTSLFKQHMNNGALKAKVRQDTREAAQKGYQGTPTFEVNGERVDFRGYQSFLPYVEMSSELPETEL